MTADADTAATGLTITLIVNQRHHTLTLDPRTTLLDALRDHLGLTGAKNACDLGQCGACTVLVDGRAVNACLSLAVMHQGAAITTVEGLARDDEPHPVQAAFLEQDALQCGFCTPGQILSAVAFLDEHPKPDESAIRRAMSGNLCRCGAYDHIVAALVQAAHRAGGHSP